MKIGLISFKNKVTFATSATSDNPAIITPGGRGTLHNVKVFLNLKSSGNVHLLIPSSAIGRSTAKLNHPTTVWTCTGVQFRRAGFYGGITAISTFIRPTCNISIGSGISGTVRI